MPGPEGSFFPQPYNSMQAQAGLTPAALPPLAIPMGMPQMQVPSPMMVAQSLQQQAAMAQYVTPQMSSVMGGTQLVAPSFMGPQMPPPLMGGGALARQRGVEASSGVLGAMQAGTGIGMRMLGGAAATALGGPLGYMAYEALGGGQMMQNMGAGIFSPIVQQRERALALQNQSAGWYTGGSALSMTGQGLSGFAAQQISSRIGRMADSHQFQRETGGMFNRGDLDRITRLSGQLGMLDQAGSADQITREVRKVSKALSNFMKLAEEPDVQQAMQQMAKMRQIGFSIPETVTAASNARTYARMAGVSVQEAMQTAMQGAGMFQQAGLSGATGFTAGLGAQGFARAGMGSMTERQLAMAGGREGLQQTLMASAATELTRDAFLPGMVRRGAGGRFEVDLGGIGGTIGQQMSRSAGRAHGFGARGLGDLLTQRRELQDQIGTQLGPEGMMMLQMQRAMQIAQQTHQGIGAGLMIATGGNEQAARSMELMMQDPNFMSRMSQQRAVSRREAAVSRRNRIMDRASTSSRMGEAWAHSVTEPLGNLADAALAPVSEYFARTQDREEALAAQGEGPATIIRRQVGVDETTAARARDTFRGPGAAARRLALSRQASARVQRSMQAEAQADQSLLGYFHGAQGWGIDREGRGGDSYRDTVLQGANFGTRMRQAFSVGAPGSAEIQRIGRGQEQVASLIDASSGGSQEEQRTRFRQAFRDLGPNMQGGRGSEALGAAAAAIRSYMGSRNTMFGMANREVSMEAMQQQMVQRMTASGMSQAEAQRAVGSEAFRQQAMSMAGRSMSESERANMGTIAERGRSSREAMRGQTTDQLNALANEKTQRMREILGVGGRLGGRFGGSSEEDTTRMRNLIGGTGDDDTLRRKIVAAYIMSKSQGDSQTSQRGMTELARLEQSTDPDRWSRLHAQVVAQVDAMDPDTVEDMAKRFSGKTAQQATDVLAQAGAEGSGAESVMQQAGLQQAIGSEAADAFNAAGGGAAGARAIREGRIRVTDRRVQRLIDSGASDSRVAEEIERSATRSTRAQSAIEASGAGESAEQREAGQVGEDLMAAIQEGMENFPGAVDRFDTAARLLDDAARRMGGNVQSAEMASALGAAGGDSPGFRP